MKILIVTQKVDRDDPVLGFFHGWIYEFAKHFESIVVVCLEKGKYDLPSNAKVFSLGKELEIGNCLSAEALAKAGKLKILKKLKYTFNFLSYILRERRNYDAVFVHMNQEYVLLGGLLWRLLGKRVALWYNHTKGTFWTRIAAYIAHRVFHTSSYAFTAQYRNAKKMPAGIDTKLFIPYPAAQKAKNSILYVGRISPMKGVHILLDAAEILYKKRTSFVLNIYGEAPQRDSAYYSALRKNSRALEEAGRVKFLGNIPNHKTPEIYNKHEVFVNLTPRGNFDKTVLEAMACGTLAIVSSGAFADLMPEGFLFKENDPESLAQKLEAAFALSRERKNVLAQTAREAVLGKHDISLLAEKIAAELQ